jgi:hypothetical protein
VTATTDPLMAVVAALTEEQRAEIVARFVRANGHWDGAEAADILDALTNHDSDLDVLEPFFEKHGDKFGADGVAEAARALIWSGPQSLPRAARITVEGLRDLLTRAGLMDGSR